MDYCWRWSMLLGFIGFHRFSSCVLLAAASKHCVETKADYFSMNGEVLSTAWIRFQVEVFIFIVFGRVRTVMVSQWSIVHKTREVSSAFIQMVAISIVQKNLNNVNKLLGSSPYLALHEVTKKYILTLRTVKELHSWIQQSMMLLSKFVLQDG